MTKNEQKQKLYEQLEMWNKFLEDEIKHSTQYTRFQARIYGVMTGMISVSLCMEIITIEESEDLESKYDLI